MKKHKMNKILKAILAPIAKGLFIFGIFAGALYVYAAISYPPEPNAVTGVVGQFIGVTSTKFTTALNYETANNYCKTGDVISPIAGTIEDTGSHICTSMELINSYNHSNEAIDAQTGNALVNNGPPGYTSFSNDCLGWSNSTGLYGGLPVYGAIWDFTKKFGKLSNCGDIVATSNYSFACCK